MITNSTSVDMVLYSWPTGYKDRLTQIYAGVHTLVNLLILIIYDFKPIKFRT